MVELSHQLGFPIYSDELANRIQHIQSLFLHVILVAEENSSKRLVGWLHGYEAPSLLSDLTAESGSLVVHEDYRRFGVGKQLVEATRSIEKRLRRFIKLWGINLFKTQMIPVSVLLLYCNAI